MALFRSIGPRTSIAPGATHQWEYWFDHGSEVGVAFVTPDMLEPQIGGHLIARENGSLQVSGRGEDGPLIHYTVHVYNNGTNWMDYKLNVGNLL